MWNKLVEIMQDPSYKRLALALLASVALHLFLLGKLDLTLPSLKKEMHVIEARIQMPKPVAKPIETLAPEETVAPKQEPLKPKPPKKQKPVKQAEQVVEKSIEPQQATETVVAEVTPEPVAEPAVEPAPPSQIQPEPPQPEPPLAEPQPVDIGLVINENAYQYIETDFDVRTKIDGSAVGRPPSPIALQMDATISLNG